MRSALFIWILSAVLCVASGCDDGESTDAPPDTSTTDDTSTVDDDAAIDTTSAADTSTADSAMAVDTSTADSAMVDTSTASDTTDSDADIGQDDASDDMTTETPPIPTEGAALESWLAEGHYLQWPAESGPHDSTGPHFGTVRTFVNPALEASLAAGASEHPAGAAAVKELYGDGAQVLGYAVEVKLADTSDGGANWYWYEGYQGSVYADGPDAGICTGCHSGGADFVLTPYPLQ